jgi:hypothetical protein
MVPDADDQEHRDQHRLPEDVEQDRVERREDADHQPFHDQERTHVLCDALLDHLPAGQHHQHRGEGGQQDQRHRDAVDAEEVLDIDAFDPPRALDELHRRGPGVEAGEQRQAGEEGQHRDRQREAARAFGLGVARGEHGETTDDRQPDAEAKNGKPGRHRYRSSSPLSRARTSRPAPPVR